MTGNIPAVLDKYLNIWTKDTGTYRSGISIDMFSEGEVSDIPEVLCLQGSRYWSTDNIGFKEPNPEHYTVKVNIDSSNFPYIYRGITGPGKERYKYCSQFDPIPPACKLLDKYAQEGFLTKKQHGGALYFSKNPAVPFAEDAAGPFLTPNGMLIVADLNGLVMLDGLHNRLIEDIEEVVPFGVPIKNIKKIYISRGDFEALKNNPLADRIKTHDFPDNNLADFRKGLLIDVIMDTAKEPRKIFEEKYSSKELVTEGKELYGRWMKDSGKFIKSNAFKIHYSVDEDYFKYPHLIIDSFWSKSHSVKNFKDKTTDLLERMEKRLDESSFAGKYGFIQDMKDEVNNETPDSFRRVDMWQIAKGISEEEEKTYNFIKFDKELSEYIFRNKCIIS